jgi:Flp pilus assembly pilin Flp
MIETLRNLWLKDQGQDLAEYSTLLALVAVAIVIAIAAFRNEIAFVLSRATSVLGS